MVIPDDPGVTCPDCIEIETEQARLHSGRLTESYHYRERVEGDDLKAYEAWAYEVRPGMKWRWLLALQSWAPNYAGAWVYAYVCPDIYGGWMIAIRGGDDVSCNQFFPNEEAAMKVWNRIPPLLDFQACADLGFNF